MLKTVKLKTAGIFLKKIPRMLGENIFLSFVFFAFSALIIGGLVFYQYAVLAPEKETEGIRESIKIKEGFCQGILEALEAREQRFKDPKVKEYPDLFKIYLKDNLEKSLTE